MIINLATARKKIEIKSQHSVRDLIYCRNGWRETNQDYSQYSLFLLEFLHNRYLNTFPERIADCLALEGKINYSMHFSRNL